MVKIIIVTLFLIAISRTRSESQNTTLAGAGRNSSVSASVLDTGRRLCETDDDCPNRSYCGKDKFCTYEPNKTALHNITDCESLAIRNCKEAGGKCIYNESSPIFLCECGKNKKLKRLGCSGPGNCQSDKDCLNGGSCAIDGYCVCGPGLAGDRCDIIVECEVGILKNCKNVGGKCLFDPKLSAAYCNCGRNKIYDPDEKRCRGFCMSGIDCYNGGFCKKDKCECISGLSGDFCDVIVECRSGDLKKCESSGGKCIFDIVSNRAYCDCGRNQQFDHKDKKCKEMCTPGDCIHGICEEIGFAFQCRCYDGFTGARCEKEIKENSPEFRNSMIAISLLLTALVVSIVILGILTYKHRRLKKKLNETKNENLSSSC